MIIAGYGGLGIELYGLMVNDHMDETIMFYDDDTQKPDSHVEGVNITASLEEVAAFFKSISANFVVGIGHPRLRQKMSNTLEDLGGTSFSYIAPTASIHPDQAPYSGLVAQPGSGISHHTSIGKSCSLHINAIVGHHVSLGDFVTIGPNASIIGPSSVGKHCRIGSNAVILPDSTIGENVIIPAGSVVRGHVKDNTTYSN